MMSHSASSGAGPRPSLKSGTHTTAAWREVAAFAAVSGAFIAAGVGYFTWGELGYNGVRSHPTPLLVAQLVVALGGLVPAGLFAYSLIEAHKRRAVVFGVALLVTYLAWGVLNDAAVHGWDALQVF